MAGHIDDPACDCGRCEPAVLDGPPTLGQVLSGNPGCDFPACSLGQGRCMWGPGTCFDPAAIRGVDL